MGDTISVEVVETSKTEKSKTVHKNSKALFLMAVCTVAERSSHCLMIPLLHFILNA